MASKAVDAVGALQPEQSLSRASPRSYKRRGPVPREVVHPLGDIQGVLPLLAYPVGLPPRAASPRSGQGPHAQSVVNPPGIDERLYFLGLNVSVGTRSSRMSCIRVSIAALIFGCVRM
jgi:hypothetical protein